MHKAHKATSNKTFILGLGCQKGGTTWLHNYLKNHHQASMGFRKEYHVLDALNLPLCQHFRDQSVAKAKSNLQRRFLLSQSAINDINHALFYSDVSTYYDYFLTLFSSPKITLTGDITPSYAGLSAETLKEVRHQLIARGFQVRVIFLMRDPVKRCVSAMRMHCRKYGIVAPDENSLLKELYSSADFEMRTRYEQTLEAIDDAFLPNEVMFGFYEELFSYPTIKSICSFLELEFVAPDFEKKINTDKSRFELSSHLLDEVAKHYESTYQAVAARFGRERIKAIWPYCD